MGDWSAPLRGRGGRARARFGRITSILLVGLLGVAVFSALAATRSGQQKPRTITGTAKADILRGSASRDLIRGLGGNDRIFGYRGSDRIEGGAGNDVIVGGAGRDALVGGPGNDRLNALDGGPDTISCGTGNDVIIQDRFDRRDKDCPAAEEPPGPIDPAKTVIRNNTSWSCLGTVDLDLVKVTLTTTVDDAVRIDQNCSGRIGRLEVETWTGDGIKVQNRGAVAHDLVIESGYVKCHDVYGDYHQDGVQAMGGHRLTFRKLRIDCLGNSNFFISEGGVRASTPTDVVCDGCVFGPNSGQTVFFTLSLRSGVRNSTICTGRFRAVRIEGATQHVDEANRVLAHDDPRCANVTGKATAPPPGG